MGKRLKPRPTWGPLSYPCRIDGASTAMSGRSCASRRPPGSSSTGRAGRPHSWPSASSFRFARISVLSEHGGFFPATALADAAQAVTEPSSLAVASDLIGDEPKSRTIRRRHDDRRRERDASRDSSVIPTRRLSPRVIGAAAAVFACAAVVAPRIARAGEWRRRMRIQASKSSSTRAHGKSAPESPPAFDVSAETAAAQLNAAASAAAAAGSSCVA